MTSSSNRIALFIDGANLYATVKTLGFDIDYKRLLKEFQSRGPDISLRNRVTSHFAADKLQDWTLRRTSSTATSLTASIGSERFFIYRL
jgi:uncharacterized LabA/DUF88 family protein